MSKPLDWRLRTRGQAQVSINLTDYEQTPLHRVFEMVRREAQRHGCAIVDTEIVGLAPQEGPGSGRGLFPAADRFRATACA